MNIEISFRNVNVNDKSFILDANKEINKLSGLNDSTFDYNIDNDLFKNKLCKCIIAESDSNPVGFLLYSYIYWANCGKGIYLSQAYVKKEYRNKGIFKMLLYEIEAREKECKFITNLVGKENSNMVSSMNKLGFKSSDLITFYRKIKER